MTDATTPTNPASALADAVAANPPAVVGLAAVEAVLAPAVPAVSSTAAPAAAPLFRWADVEALVADAATVAELVADAQAFNAHKAEVTAAIGDNAYVAVTVGSVTIDYESSVFSAVLGVQAAHFAKRLTAAGIDPATV